LDEVKTDLQGLSQETLLMMCIAYSNGWAGGPVPLHSGTNRHLLPNSDPNQLLIAPCSLSHTLHPAGYAHNFLRHTTIVLGTNIVLAWSRRRQWITKLNQLFSCTGDCHALLQPPKGKVISEIWPKIGEKGQVAPLLHTALSRVPQLHL